MSRFIIEEPVWELFPELSVGVVVAKGVDNSEAKEEELKDILAAELEKDSAEYMLLKQEIENNKGGKVVVNYTIYPGVCIYIANRVYPVKDMRSRCQFRLDGADVVSMPI